MVRAVLNQALWLMAGASLAWGQEEPPPLRDVIDRSVGWYEVYSDAEPDRPLPVQTVMRWTNNARGSEEGVTIIWTRQGRPEAMAAIYPWQGRLHHEFDSLARGSIFAKDQQTGAVVWRPAGDGVAFQDVPAAPDPAESRPARLRQMKALAERFGSTMLGWKGDDSDREQLRLLTRPLFRYPGDPPEVMDGAMFAFVQGTDPESILLLEATRPEAEGGARWRFAFVRQTSGALEGRFDDKVVWTVEKHPVQNDPASPHFTISGPLADRTD